MRVRSPRSVRFFNVTGRSPFHTFTGKGTILLTIWLTLAMASPQGFTLLMFLIVPSDIFSVGIVWVSLNPG
ncbi:hypothetical protein LINPERPRIM_LOCUS21296 [Linum perenne]